MYYIWNLHPSQGELKMPYMNRRKSFRHAGLGSLAAVGLASQLLPHLHTDDHDHKEGSPAHSLSGSGDNPFAVATYSFWRFRRGLCLPIEKCIDEAARMSPEQPYTVSHSFLFILFLLPWPDLELTTHGLGIRCSEKQTDVSPFCHQKCLKSPNFAYGC
jgi:hypothetical protein